MILPMMKFSIKYKIIIYFANETLINIIVDLIECYNKEISVI